MILVDQAPLRRLFKSQLLISVRIDTVNINSNVDIDVGKRGKLNSLTRDNFKR